MPHESKMKLKSSISFKKENNWEFPDGPVVRTPHFHCQESGFDPWSGNQDPASSAAQPQKNKRKENNFGCLNVHPARLGPVSFT